MQRRKEQTHKPNQKTQPKQTKKHQKHHTQAKTLCSACSASLPQLMLFHLFCVNAVSLVSLAAKASCGCGVFGCVAFFLVLALFGLVSLLVFAFLHAFVPSLTGAQRTDSSPAIKKYQPSCIQPSLGHFSSPLIRVMPKLCTCNWSSSGR